MTNNLSKLCINSSVRGLRTNGSGMFGGYGGYNSKPVKISTTMSKISHKAKNDKISHKAKNDKNDKSEESELILVCFLTFCTGTMATIVYFACTGYSVDYVINKWIKWFERNFIG